MEVRKIPSNKSNDWLDWIENKLRFLMLAGFCAMLAGQVLPGRIWAWTSQSGQAVPVIQNTEPPAAKVTFRLAEGEALEAPAEVRINGILVGEFQGSSYTVVIRPKDMVTIDTSGSGRIYDFFVDHNDPLLTSPIVGEEFESSQIHPATIGPMLFKQ